MLECVVNVSEGRRADVLDVLTASCAPALLDVHVDPDHNRSVFTLAGADVEAAARQLAAAAVARIDLRAHDGVHPRFGAVDVVPFVALAGSTGSDAIAAARQTAEWLGATLRVPAFLYGDATADHRSLPSVRAGAFAALAPDFGPATPHPSAGAAAVGARPVLAAVNCVLTPGTSLETARRIAGAVRERDGGLPGVRALAFALESRDRVQVSMNVTDLAATGIEAACLAVRDHAHWGGSDVDAVEVVGLVPAAELARCSAAFVSWAGLSDAHTIEARLRDAGLG